MSIKGLDLSSYQEDQRIDFEKVREAGYEFVIIKATEGVGYTNPYFNHDVPAAHQADLVVGAYVFFRCEQDGVAQASRVHEVLSSHPKVKFVVIDFEEKPATQDAQHAHLRLHEFRTVLRQHGYRTVTYSYASFLDGIVPNDCKFCASDPLWLANYTDKPEPFKPWDHVTIWQNSQTGHVPGISGAVDLDEFEGNEKDWQDFLAGKEPGRKPKAHPDWYHRLLQFPPTKLRDPGHTEKHAGHTYQTGHDVDAVQRKLGVKPTGRFDPATVSHVKGFQRQHNLTPDGVVGPETARKIEEKH